MAVNGIDFTIPEQAIVSLIGPNGAGKTTFFNIIAGIYDPSGGRSNSGWRSRSSPSLSVPGSSRSSGSPPSSAFAPHHVPGGQRRAQAVVVLGDRALTVIACSWSMVVGVARLLASRTRLPRFGVFKSARPNDMVVAGLGRTFQNIRLFPNMTALENVLVGMHTRLKATWLDALRPTPRDRREEVASAGAARELLALVGFAGVDIELGKNPAVRRPAPLEIARALGSNPALLLLDEPTAGMNPNETQQLTGLIGRLRRDLG